MVLTGGGAGGERTYFHSDGRVTEERGCFPSDGGVARKHACLPCDVTRESYFSSDITSFLPTWPRSKWWSLHSTLTCLNICYRSREL